MTEQLLVRLKLQVQEHLVRLLPANAAKGGHRDEGLSGRCVGWKAAAFAAAGAFPLRPGSRDTALLLTLAPGTYTALLSDQAGRPGIGLVEVYSVP